MGTRDWNNMNVCFYFPGDVLPSALLCGYEQLKYLERVGAVKLKTATSSSVLPTTFIDSDVFFLPRCYNKYDVELAKLLRKLGKTLFYILDDDLLNVPDYIDWDRRFEKSRANMNQIMSQSDYLVTPSLTIAEKYGYMFKDVIMIEEPSLGNDNDSDRGDVVKIGFAGSLDRSRDIDKLISQPLRIIKDKYNDKVEIEFFGANPSIAGELKCRHVPFVGAYQDYQEEMEKLHWDIGLAPMPDTPFHACKHYNKFIEYGGYGIIPVCSNRLPYTRVIKNGENGFLCNDNTEEWVNAMSSLIDSRGYRDLLKKNIKEQIEREFSIETVSRNFWQQVEKLDVETKPISLFGVLSLVSFSIRNSLFVRKLRQYGIKFPIVVLKKLYRKLKAVL